jgi:uncharacterized membrane protein YeaQ/YmgE (transglycosylase-associated protein family)
MDLPGFFGTIILGGLSGWIASELTRGHGLGLMWNIVVGITGAILASLVMMLFGGVGVTGFNLWSFFVAIAGSVILLLLVNAFASPRNRRL